MTSKIGLKHIHAIAPYVGGRPISEVAREYGLDESKIVKLASNENPLGMPQSAQEAMIKAASHVYLVADSTKINKSSFTRLGSLDVVHSFITDDGITDADAKEFERRGIEVLIAR